MRISWRAKKNPCQKGSESPLKRYALSLLLGWFCIVLGSAQTFCVKGQITNAWQHRPLSGATIRASKTLVQTESNADGAYCIRLPKLFRGSLSIAAEGYATRLVHLPHPADSDTIRCDIALSPLSEYALQGASVIGRSAARQLKESALPVSVITADQLQGTASSINDVLARTVGVTIRNTGGVGSASRISVRGLEGKRIGLFVDGTPLGQVSNYVTLNDIPTDMIERIEIYKGIVPYKFGGSALGGAINVVMKEYPKTYTDIGYEIGSFHTHKLDAISKWTNAEKGTQWAIGGGLVYAGNDYNMRLRYLDDRKVRRDHDQYHKYMVGISLKATHSWWDELKWENVFLQTRQALQGIDFDYKKAYNHSLSFIESLSLKKKNCVWEGLDVDIDAAYDFGLFGLHDKALRRFDWDGKSYATLSPLGGETGPYASDGRNRSHDFIGKINMNFCYNVHHTFNLNVYGNYTQQRPKNELMDKSFGYRTNFPSRMGQVTTGWSYDLTLFKGKLQSALTLKNFYFSSHSRMLVNNFINRLTVAKTHRNYWGWSEALIYHLNANVLFKTGYQSEVRIPTAEELVGNGYSILPTPNLRPERTSGFHLGSLYHHASRYGFTEIEVNLFHNTLQDMIRFTADMLPTLARYRNFGKVRTYGIEAEIKADCTPWLYAYINGTYQDLRDVRRTLPGMSVENPTYRKRMPNIPYAMANAGIEWHKANLFGGRGQQSRWLLDGSYIHAYYYDFEMSKYQERKIPTAMIWNTALEHSFDHHRWTITLKVQNLMNKERYSELNRPLPGRTFLFKVRYLLH